MNKIERKRPFWITEVVDSTDFRYVGHYKTAEAAKRRMTIIRQEAVESGFKVEGDDDLFLVKDGAGYTEYAMYGPDERGTILPA